MRDTLFTSKKLNTSRRWTNRKVKLHEGLFSLTALSLVLSACEGAGGGGNGPTPTPTNKNAPKFASGPKATASVKENMLEVGTFTATDEDENDTITYSLKNTQDFEQFSIDSNSGELLFNINPDYEIPKDVGGDNVYNVTITATDSGSKTAEHALTVTVEDVNESPKFADDVKISVNVAENTQSVGTYTATDEDKNNTVTYSLRSYGLENAHNLKLFDIDPTTGELTFKSNPDFETPGSQAGTNVYNVEIVATDNNGAKSVHTLVVRVTDENEHSPEFTSGLSETESIDENKRKVGTYVATDADAGDIITYSVSGADFALFEIDSVTGELTFASPPDFETMVSKAGTKVYKVTITATDKAGATDTHDLSVTVTDVDETGSNEVPEFASDLSDTISLTENTREVGTYTATDADAGDTITYSVSGADSEQFRIDSATGELTFKTAPDYETPSSKLGTNVYSIVIVATDSRGKRAEHALGVTVTDVIGETLSGGAGNDTLKAGIGADILSGGAGDDSLIGGVDNDTLAGELGDDSLEGGAGDDVYLYSRGGGSDTFADTAGTDTIKFEGIDIESIELDFSGSDMLIKFRENASSDRLSTTDVIMVTNGKTTGRIEKFQIGDEFYDVRGIVSSKLGTSGNDFDVEGSDGGDWLSGGGSSDIISGKAGDDYVFGGAGDDILDGGAGDDYVFGGAGDDIISGGAGDDSLYGGAGDDSFYGGAGNDYFIGGEGDDFLNDAIDGDDSFYGGAGSDTFFGGKDDDYLNGGEDDDQYIFFITDNQGNDTIEDSGGSDTIILGNGIFEMVSTSDVKFVISGNDLKISYSDKESDKLSIRIKGWKTNKSIEKLEYYDISGQQTLSGLNSKTFTTTETTLATLLAESYDADDAEFSSDVDDVDLLGLSTDTSPYLL